MSAETRRGRRHIQPTHPQRKPMAKLARTRNTLGENACLLSAGLLNAALAALMDLTNAVRMAHWTVRDPNFAALHATFEEF